jgi:uncharacterized protein YjiS (DUF1127 family)
MSIVDRVDAHVCAAELAHSSILPGTAYDTPSQTGQYDDSGSPVGSRPAGEAPARRNGSPQAQSKPDALRRPIATTMSRLLERFEGSAAHGEALYPSFSDPGELIDRQEPDSDSQSCRQTQDEHGNKAPWLNASHPRTSADPGRSTRAQTASPGWSARIASSVARFWSSMHRERAAWLATKMLEALDDRTLKDIGLHRSQIASVVRHGDRCGR